MIKIQTARHDKDELRLHAGVETQLRSVNFWPGEPAGLVAGTAVEGPVSAELAMPAVASSGGADAGTARDGRRVAHAVAQSERPAASQTRRQLLLVHCWMRRKLRASLSLPNLETRRRGYQHAAFAVVFQVVHTKIEVP